MTLFLILIPLIIIFFDRLSKWWALTVLCESPLSVWGDYFSCILTYNRGVSWSLLSYQTIVGFSLITALVISVIIILCIYTIRQYQANQMIIGELLVFGGAVSNLYDRFAYGGVVDFILLRSGDWSFPVFNIADIAIVFGVILMIYAALRQP
jgi:signal peptidase II